MPPRIIEPSHGRKPWPSYFLVRTTGEVVPLIAVDELPPGTNLINIPRTLELEATTGMLNLGRQRSSGGYYQISSASSRLRTPEIPTQAKNSVAKTLPSIAAPESTTSTEDEEDDTEAETSLPSPSTARVPLHTNSNIQDRARLPPSYNNPQNSTSLCRHWCTHGICKWGQQCRYKHIMPMTLHSLQEVGLRDWPAWYRGLNPGYFVDSREIPDASVSRGLGLKGRENGVARFKRDDREKRVVGSGGGERRSAAAKGEEVGDQILKRLRSMDKKREREKEREIILKSKMEQEKENDRKAAIVENNAVVVERAATTGLLRWEDEESEVEELERLEDKKKKMESEGSRKLVDI